MTETELSLSELYDADETAWLDAMTDLLRRGTLADLDYPHLLEYLTDMAKRDRREVESRLAVLLLHVLKWEHQPVHRSGSWRSSIKEQRYELNRHAGQGVLRNHAEAVLADAYAEAVDRAADETGLPPAAFPGECPYTLDQLLNYDPA